MNITIRHLVIALLTYFILVGIVDYIIHFNDKEIQELNLQYQRRDSLLNEVHKRVREHYQIIERDGGTHYIMKDADAIIVESRLNQLK